MAVFLIGMLSVFGILPITITIYQRAVGILPAVLYFIIACAGGKIGGGDIKLLAALGFTVGYAALIPILGVAGVTALIWAKAKRVDSIPFGTFIAVGAVTMLF